jgi:nucleoside-diphosphate-sugar epimerase
VLEACREVDDPLVVYASSSSVYGNACSLPLREDADCRPHSPYGVTKLAGEGLCQLYTDNFGLHTVSLRFFTVYGPRQRPDMAFNRFIRRALADEPIVINGDGRQTRDFTYVDDIVGGLRAAHRAPAGTVANLGGGQRISLLDAVAELGEVLGAPVNVEHRAREAGDVRDTWADVSVASSALDWSPSVGVLEGLAREVEWLQDCR